MLLYKLLDFFRFYFFSVFSNKKYILLYSQRKDNLYRIKYLRYLYCGSGYFSCISRGELGGYLESENNLSHYSNACVCDNACVFGDAYVYDNARVCDNACVCGNACVFGDARVCDNACVCGNACVFGDAYVYDNARVCDNACVCGNACVFGDARVCDNACVCGNACVFGDAYVYDNARVCDNACVCGNACVFGDARVCDNACVCGNACVFGDAYVYDNARVSGKARVYGNIYLKTGNYDFDVLEDKEKTIQRLYNILPKRKGVYVFYKVVNKNMTSDYDKKFKYKLNVIAKVKDYDESHISCSSGLHVGPLYYRNLEKDQIVLECEVKVKDIITLAEGKLRCKAIKPIKKVGRL